MRRGASRISVDVARALGYPFARPAESFVHVPGAGPLELVAIATWDGSGVLVRERAGATPRTLAALGLWGAREPFPLAGGAREAMVAYGANASAAALEAKLAVDGAAASAPVPVLGVRLAGFDVVYSAHVSAYGSVPATMARSAGTEIDVHVVCVTAAQRRRIDATEYNYEVVALDALARVDVPDGGSLTLGGDDLPLLAYRSRHGALALDGAPAALRAIAARGRRLAALDEPAVLAAVRDALDPGADLASFIAAAVREPGVVDRRTVTLRRTSLPQGW